MIEVVITCVVETGKPRWAVVSSTAEAAVSAAKPCTGVSFTSRMPSVRMMRLPPE